MNWKPVIIFYVKTTSWIILPLGVGLLLGRFTSSQTLFLVFLMLGFGITCYGIYKEIKEYKNQLDQSDNNQKK